MAKTSIRDNEKVPSLRLNPIQDPIFAIQTIFTAV
jgi:hypothetical protein